MFSAETMVGVQIASQLGKVISATKEKVQQAVNLGLVPGKDELADFVAHQLTAFQPALEGRPLLGDEERRDLSRALAGIALNMVPRKQETKP